VAWVFFRAADISGASGMLKAMAGMNGFGAPPLPPVRGEVDLLLLGLGAPTGLVELTAIALYLGAIVIVFAMPNSQEIIEPARCAEPPRQSVWALRAAPSGAWAVMCAGLVFASMMTFTRVTEFIYFQF
jgi:alginate O-acetyltransferase complex protein AlgI